MKKILIIEDNESQQEILSLLIKREVGYQTCAAFNGRRGLELLKKYDDIALIILDMGLPDIHGLELLPIIKESHPDIPIIILTGETDVELTVEAMKLGALDYLNKPMEKERMRTAITNALKTSSLEKEVSRLRKKSEGHFTFDQLVGHDGGLRDVVTMGQKAASCDIPVFISGETGTGKEVLARAIHGESRRCGNPFIAVNCGALPEQLVESILFGHEKGAFTGAFTKSPGSFKEANGGTIFLDEIGDLPLSAQVKLLRVIQQKEIVPVGAAHPVPINIRIISATNIDLEKAVLEGRFREDLFFRLNVLPLHLPALRERPQDIEKLAHYFIESISAREHLPLRQISAPAMAVLKKHHWQGNVRELENTLHRAIIMAEHNELRPSDFSTGLLTPNRTETEVSSNYKSGFFIPRSLEEIEKEAIQNTIIYYNGSIAKAAEVLGIAKSTIYRKLNQEP